MKKLSIMMAALLVAMTGCQKEPQVTPEAESNAKAYVSLKINLPSEIGTRAESTFDDGIGKEFDVENVTLVFFNESNKVVFTKVETPAPWSGDANTKDNITTTAQTAAIDVTGKNVKSVLVLVNNVLENSKIADENKYDQVNAALENIDADDLTGSGNAFFMSNAPYINGSEIVTLVDVTTFDTAANALEKPATVKVERAVAKIDMGTAKDTEKDVKNSADEIIGTFKMAGWMLDNTNTTTYPVRVCDYSTWKDGSNWLNGGFYYETGSKRIHFAVDPNYDEEATNLETTTTFSAETESVAYCLENTFTTSYQKEPNTTRVIIQAVYTPKDFTSGETWFRVGSAQIAYKKADFIALLKANSEAEDSAIETAVAAYKAGVVDFSPLDASLSTTLGDVLCYENGLCYYEVLIRHFTDEELGYDTSGANSFNTKYTGTYVPSDIGRYSVVRNNWYKLTVNTVSQVGTPTVPPLDNVNDDVKNQYLSCKIEILAWAIRNQSVDL